MMLKVRYVTAEAVPDQDRSACLPKVGLSTSSRERESCPLFPFTSHQIHSLPLPRWRLAVCFTTFSSQLTIKTRIQLFPSSARRQRNYLQLQNADQVVEFVKDRENCKGIDSVILALYHGISLIQR
jgi:hypothetical protein